MELTIADATKVIHNGHNHWSEVKGTREIVDQGRWSTIFAAVFLYKPSGKHYSLSWARPSTEGQEEGPFENDDPNPCEVELREVTKHEWLPV